MFRFAIVYTILFVLLAPGAVRAQTDHDNGLWMALFAQGNLETCHDDGCCDEGCCEDESPAPRFKWWFDGHARFLDDADGFNQSIVRPGLGWAVSENATLWAGYGWIHTSPLRGDDFDENRVWQQLTWSKQCDPLTFAFRSRLEQRFLETGDDTGWRFRQLVRVQHGLPCCPRLTLVAWDELFIHLNDTDWGARAGFDQNRVFVGFGFKCDPESRCRTEIGYLNQTINVLRGANRSHHILSINFYRGP